jgi:endonuclease/exonuclease/phosphatase family metal-dependent hydrolase
VQENRLTQANYLNELLVRDHSAPTILAGDMNARPDSVVMNLFDTFWLNPLAAQPAFVPPPAAAEPAFVPPPVAAQPAFVPPAAAAPQRGPGGPNRGFGFRSDYVLARPAGSWRAVETTVLDETVASDHRPVLVVLEWVGAH